MFEPFEVENEDNEKFLATYKRDAFCWELNIHTQTKEYAGWLRFSPIDANSVKIIDFHISSKFARKGVGTEIIKKLLESLRERGFNSVVGICKSFDRPLAEKEKLAQWYKKLGFTLIRESMATEPGYMGKLFKKL